VSAWLKGNTSATILYIGAHGAHNGLTAVGSPGNLDKIGYRELADNLAIEMMKILPLEDEDNLTRGYDEVVVPADVQE
jgi:hypothetical protein